MRRSKFTRMFFFRYDIFPTEKIPIRLLLIIILALSFAHGSVTPTSLTPLKIRPFTSPARLNPFGLTFSMGRLVSSANIGKDPSLKAELADIVENFDQWDPPDKSIKYALEGLQGGSLRDALFSNS